MAFDERERPSGRMGARVAVIGSGAAGLSAAWLLSHSCEVVVYEAGPKLGGHANTVDVPVAAGRTVPVDAGFIVYNEPAYPNLTALFAHLKVATEETCMSFAASMRGGALEYSGQSLSSVFADRSKALSPSFIGMLLDVARFNEDARRALAEGFRQATLAEFVAANGYGRSFVRDFLKPMASAIWSTPARRILDFSAEAFIRFYANHGLLRVLNRSPWRTVNGASREYVRKISAPIASMARLATPVVEIARTPSGVRVRDADGGVETFQDVVIATHANTALSLIAEPSGAERALLSAFRYQPNEAFVHFDDGAMPKRRRTWASWNFVGDDDTVAVTYWMNRLQTLNCADNIFVTLNPREGIAPEKTVARFSYEHPMFDLEAYRAQQRIWSLQGVGGLWFCGAHFGQGFHEDAVQAGLAVAEAIGGVRRPWTVANESARICVTAPAASLAAE